MGNDPDKKEEYITFELIQESLGIKNPNLFKKYLQEVFVDLSTKVENSKSKCLTRLTFYDYIKLPIFLSEKLFNSFASSSQQEGLKEEEFVTGFFKLYMGTFSETTQVIFNLLDFDKDGIIKKEDVKIILSYLPLNDVSEEKEKKLESVREVLGFQMKSLEEIDDIVSKTFKKYEDKMNFEQFKDTVQNKKSDVLLQLICFLYQEKPFSSRNIESMKLKYGDIEDEEYEKMMKAYGNRSRKGVSVRIKTPNQTSMLSPAGSFFKRRFSIKGVSLNENKDKKENTEKKEKKDETENKENGEDKEKKDSKDNSNKNVLMQSSKSVKSNFSKLSSKDFDLIVPEEIANKNLENNIDAYDKNLSMVRLNNERTLEDYHKFKKNKERNENLKELMDNSKQRYSSPTKYLQERAGLNSLALMNKEINYEKNLCPINEVENEFANNDNIEEEKNICYENWVYKLTENKKLKKFYLVLINKDIFYYKDQEKKNFLGMHNLSGCFIQEGGENEKVEIERKSFYIFEIFFNNKSKTRKYYTPDIEISKNFVTKIKEAIGYMKFTDFYELKEVIGKGKFGVVNLGIHKKTQQQVAVKIINKDSIKTAEDKELVRIEIGILKLCHHPNVVRLLDHLENEDYIFIVTEYIEGGTLGQYFKKKNFNFSERQASSIMVQIASGVKYLHTYGIVHRDLKPDNIMITQQNEFGVIKIMDFGLSKIVSTQEKMVDGYGTLSYVAPEVLLRTPYNKEVDIWSMGVILYYMLCGHLPFKGNKEVIIAEKIVNDDLEFDEDEWEVRSKKVRDLITSCLKKEPEERITIDEFLNHPWFKKLMKPKNSV
jgi:hypothetical protein